MADEGSSTTAQFRYIDPRGNTYLVVGEPDDPMRFQRVPMWQGFRVDVYTNRDDEAITPVPNWFMLTIELGLNVAGHPGLTESEMKLKWLRGLRRYALDCIMSSLDTGKPARPDDIITSARREELSAYLARRCEFMVADVSGTLCRVNARDDPATTQSICNACTLPDIWERCKHVCNVRTHPIRTDQDGIIRRECTAQCNMGKRPSQGGGVPSRCRYGPSTPSCFEPQLLRAEPRAEPKHLGLRPPDQH